MSYIFTSESVAEGHPDKVCDQISDALVDLYLRADPKARLAIETVATTNYVGIFGEIGSTASFTHDQIENHVREVVRKIGYEQPGFHWGNLEFQNRLHAQSPDIAQGVTGLDDREEGAGDQGIMFGYAVDETPDLMPAPLHYSHRILESIAEARKMGSLPYLGVDAKSQVSLKFENGQPVGIDAIVVSTQHHDSVDVSEIRQGITPFVMKVFPSHWECPNYRFFVNPTGKFVIGGPDGDTGLTGRKIIVDTYGGAAPHGGGAFSGKDPSKVDRSGAYMARYLAKNIVASGLAKRCTLQFSYAIGVAQPVSIFVKTHQTGLLDPQVLVDFIRSHIDLTPKGIRNTLNLNAPIYQKTSYFGHFGRTPSSGPHFPWEDLNLVPLFQSLIPSTPQEARR